MSRKKPRLIEPQTQNKIQAEIWWAVLSHLSALASLERDETLLNAGIAPELLETLKHQSSVSLRELSLVLTQTHSLWDIEQLARQLRLAAIPDEAKKLITFGANNKVMMHYLRANAAQCSKWREDLEVEKPFRARCLPTNKALAIIMERLQALCKTYSPTSIPAQELLSIAQEYQVSLGALWVELEKWDLKK